MLLNPTYAGAFAYGRRQAQRRVGADGRARASIVPMPRERWRTLILDHHPGYITWEQHEQILGPGRQQPLRCPARAARRARVGRCCRGSCAAAAAGGGCTGPTRVRAAAGTAATSAIPGRAVQIGGRPECQGIGGRGLDEAVLAEVFRVLEPAALAATAKALADRSAEDARLRAFGPPSRAHLRGRARPPPVRRLRTGEPAGRPRPRGRLGASGCAQPSTPTPNWPPSRPAAPPHCPTTNWRCWPAPERTCVPSSTRRPPRPAIASCCCAP